MKKPINISELFPKHLFWDVKMSRLDVVEDKDLIIPRGLYATSKQSFEKDIQRLEQLYSKKEILDVLRQTKEKISNQVCLMVASRYQVQPFLRWGVYGGG
ncbi:MAG: hypothetical protein OXC92_11360 [Flavobacteriaceae bacterium]|nr:hypothetical protein [Flavobacteriaceae bacterium]